MTSPVLDSNTGVDLFADYEDGQTLTGAAAPVAVTQREVPGSDQLKEVRVAAIVANAPAQTRGRANATGTYFDPEHSLDDLALANSIQEHGQVEPVIVEIVAGDNSPWPGQPVFRLIAGHRRVAACRHVGQEWIQAIIRRPASAYHRDAATLIENMQKPLAPMEMALAIDQLRREHKKTYEQIAHDTGIPGRTLKRYARLLTAPPELQDLMKRATLQMRVMDLVFAAPRGEQMDLALIALANDLSVSEVEELLDEAQQEKKRVREVAQARQLATPDTSELALPAAGPTQAGAKDGDGKTYRRGSYSRHRHLTPAQKRAVLERCGLKSPSEKLLAANLEEADLRVAALLVKGGMTPDRTVRVIANDDPQARRIKKALARLDEALRTTERAMVDSVEGDFGRGLTELTARLQKLNKRAALKQN